MSFFTSPGIFYLSARKHSSVLLVKDSSSEQLWCQYLALVQVSMEVLVLGPTKFMAWIKTTLKRADCKWNFLLIPDFGGRMK